MCSLRGWPALLVLEVLQAFAVRPITDSEAGIHNSKLALPSTSSRTRGGIFAGAHSQALANVSLEHALAAGSWALESAEMDAELGSDAKVSSMVVLAGAGGGAGNLKDYCSGKGGNTVQKDARVEADWKNYGTFYPAKVKDVNKDGTIDVKYDDGFREKNIKTKNFRPLEGEEVETTPPKDDPACQIVDGLETVKKRIKKANHDVASWLAAQRAKKNGRHPDVTPPPLVIAEAGPAPAPGAAPAPAVAPTAIPSDDPEKNARLEELKATLAAKDEEIRQLEARVSANDEEIRKAMEGENKDGAKTIDDLIAEYESLIARRQEWIDFLKDKEAKQQNQLTSLGHSAISLDEIDKSVEDIVVDVDKLKMKRDELEKDGKLDPELQSAIDNIVKQVGKLREKLDLLLEAQRNAERQRQLAKERAAQKKAAAKAKGEEDDQEAGKRADGAENSEDSEDEEDAEAKAAEEAVLKAAEDVDEELQKADEETKKLDTGVHPHGEKWWRYRYEHSFVEAVMMIFILFLMLIWERFFRFLRQEAYSWSDMDAFQAMEHSTMYISWLEFFTGELMVCLLVFLTVWLLGKLQLLHYFTVVLKEDKQMHLPDSGEEYQHIAIDICVVLFWAIVLYFVLALSIVHASMEKFSEWAELESRSSIHNTDALTGRAHRRMFSFVNSPADWICLKKYFLNHIQQNPDLWRSVFGDAEMGSPEFSMWMYLRANVRAGSDVFFQFGVLPWSLLIATFFVFMLLHYYMHMGYIRIMSFFLVALVVQLLCLCYFTSSLSSTLRRAQEADSADGLGGGAQQLTIHNKVSTEKILALSCFYNLFILCYGISRVVCQPWMWELHFEVALYLTIATALLVVAFCLFLAPIFPIFLAVLALPPYVDPDNLALMKNCVNEGSVTATVYLKNQQEHDDKSSLTRNLSARSIRRASVA